MRPLATSHISTTAKLSSTGEADLGPFVVESGASEDPEIPRNGEPARRDAGPASVMPATSLLTRSRHRKRRRERTARLWRARLALRKS